MSKEEKQHMGKRSKGKTVKRTNGQKSKWSKGQMHKRANLQKGKNAKKVANARRAKGQKGIVVNDKIKQNSKRAKG